MNKEQQIKEMARALCGNSYNAEKGYCNKSDEECDFMCPPYLKSKRIYALGYGDTKQAVKEFAEKLKEKVEKAEEEIVPKGCDSYFKNGAMCCQSIIFLILDELVKEVCGD